MERRNSNFHSHCSFCDGRNTPEEFVKAAIAKKFRAYGFSSHSPLPFETFWNMPKSKIDEYLAEINRLKNIYATEIEIYVGMEIDYLDKTYNASIPFFQSMPLDYRISSVHFIPWQNPLLEENMTCIDGSYEGYFEAINKHYNGDIHNLINRFFESSMSMVEEGGFEIVGHIDKVYMNAVKNPGFDIRDERYRKPFLELLSLIAEKELIVEINTKNKTRKGQIYPHPDMFKELKKREIPIVVNSDCHFSDLVDSDIEETILLLKEVGFRTTRELANGIWQDIAI